MMNQNGQQQQQATSVLFPQPAQGPGLTMGQSTTNQQQPQQQMIRACV